MSEPLRVAAAVEGPSDTVVLQAIVAALLPDREFELQTLQPEESRAFGGETSSMTGTGWVGVYRWSRQAALEGGGSVSKSSALKSHDLVIVHVDADVAGKSYSSGGIEDAPWDDLPCEEPCPPVSNTTNALRMVVLKWLGEVQCPRRVVLCTPSKSIEAWMVAAVWPDNSVVQRSDWECRPNPGGQLGALPKARRFGKNPDDYGRKVGEVVRSWPSLTSRLSEAKRFSTEFLRAVPA